MASDPKIRASDADRDRAAALLREHHAAGRLTAEEFNERLDQAYSATTVGDIDRLLADLPVIDLYHLPEESMRREGAAGILAKRPAGEVSHALVAACVSWGSVSLAAFAIWLATGHPDSLWFLWIAGGYGIFMLRRLLIRGMRHRGGA